MTTQEELRQKVEQALHIDWAFKDVHGKPDKIIVEGTPKGTYHTSYEKFLGEMVDLIASQVAQARVEFAQELVAWLGNNFPVDGNVACYKVGQKAHTLLKELNASYEHEGKGSDGTQS